MVAARRNSPLVVGLGEGENFLGSDVAAFIEHTREALELGQDQVVTITRDGVEVTDFDGNPAEGKRYHVDWDLSAAEKDGYDWFMRKEIFEQPRAVADTLLGRHDRGRPAPARRGAALRRGAARHRQDHHRRLRHRLLRGHGREVRDRALDPDPVRGRARARVPLPRPDPDPQHAGGRDQPVRRDHRHADGDPARPRAAGQGAGDLQHQRLDDPARVRRGDLHPRRPGDRGRLDQGLPDPDGRLLPARALPRPGPRHQVRRRDRAPSSTSWSKMPDARRSRCSTAPRRSTSWPASSSTAQVGAVPRPARRLPGRARGRAQAQGAGLHPRRGLRRRRAQARPDRADRARAAGVLRGAAPGPRPAARQDGQRHPGGPGPRRPHHRARRGGRRRRSTPYADTC